MNAKIIHAGLNSARIMMYSIWSQPHTLYEILKVDGLDRQV
ncbi:hypothetical protein D1AOALGA4SA_3556 [Olavius algarvensis Delta 1 endosymbiont]|nr:hypothetical protein D1AOALGA4SA_3556 [Olavius algarvensis Delta 1 endosymbiont]